MVSIIVPIYNVEKFLDRCIQSIIKQSYKDLEIILVDDGSTDSCPSICQSYSHDDRIKIVTKSYGGVSDARNAGVEAANGEWIAFVDSDDWISDDYCEKLLALATSHNADIAECGYAEVFSDSQKIQNEAEVVAIKQTNYEKQFNMRISLWAKLFKRQLFDNIRFPVGKIYEDYFVYYKLNHLANKIVVSNYKIYYYFQRQGSIMKSRLSQKNLVDLDAAWERIEYYKANSMSDLLYIAEFELLVKLVKAVYILKNNDIDNKKTLIKDYKSQAKALAKKLKSVKNLEKSKKLFCRMTILCFPMAIKIYKKRKNFS